MMTPDQPPSATLLENLILYATMVGAWIFGEGTKAAFAGAAGGLVRWMMSERRRIRDGIISVTSGALMAHYGTPLMLAILEKWMGELRGDAGFAAAFCSGLVGMSLAKLVIAYIDAQGRKVGGGADD